MKTKLAYVGRGALNLVVVLAVVIGLRVLILGRVPGRMGLIALSIVLVASYLAGVRWIERRQPSELLTRAGFTEFAAGLALGLGLFTAVMLLLWMFGVYHPSGWGSIAPLAVGFLLALAGAIFEEIIFRGFLFRLARSCWVRGVRWPSPPRCSVRRTHSTVEQRQAAPLPSHSKLVSCWAPPML